MTLARLRYDRTSECLHLDGFGPLLTESGDDFLAPVTVIEDVRLAELRRAFVNFSDDQHGREPYLSVSDDDPEHFSELSDRRLHDIALRAGRLVLLVGAITESEPAPAARLTAILQAAAARRRAAVRAVDVSVRPGYWIVTAEVDWLGRAARVADALNLADELGALLSAGLGGEITQTTGADLVRAGHAELLVGMPESQWLEAKSAPYRLGEPGEDVELAKDVAALANADGGLLLIGAKTRRRNEQDVIVAINECRLADISRRRYRGVIDRLVYPYVEDLLIEPIAGSAPGDGVVLITVGRQDDGKRPFLIAGAIPGTNVKGSFVAIPTRRDEDTSYCDIATLHARLRAGELYLATQQRPARDLAAELDAVREQSVDEWLRDFLPAVRSASIAVQLARGAATFSRDGYPPVVVSTGSRGPLLDVTRRQDLLERLAEMGLPTRRTARGYLAPDVPTD